MTTGQGFKSKKKISRSLLTGTLLILLALGIGLGVQGTSTYREGMMERYQAHLESLLRLTATQIDADDLAACIDSGVKSEQFEKEQAYLDQMKETCDIKYVYVVKPLNTNASDNMMNILAGVSEQERALYADKLVQLGQLTGTEYSPEVAAVYLARMDRSDDITYYSNTTEFGHMYTGLMPLHSANGEPVAILAIDIEMDVIRQTLSRYTLITGASVILLALLSLMFTFVWLRRRIIRPIVGMEAASSSFVASSRNSQDPDKLHFDKPEIHTQDEMEALSDALMAMSEDMKRYMKTLIAETAERERIGAELNVATQIQADMLPRSFPAFPERREFDIYASMTPAKEVGGDFYDFFLIDDDHLGLVMADVSGKGVPAALFMVIAKTLIKNQAQACEYSPAKVLASVNEQLCEGNEAELFVTVWLAILEIGTGKGMAANAGHEHPTLRRADGKYELVEYRHSPAVATMEGIRFREHEFELRPGDSLFVYTDGVAEATNEKKEFYGTERMLAALNESPDAAPAEVLAAVRRSVDEFVGDAPQFDDITMLCFKYFGPDGAEGESV